MILRIWRPSHILVERWDCSDFITGDSVQLSASVKEMTNNGVGISDLFLPHTSPPLAPHKAIHRQGEMIPPHFDVVGWFWVEDLRVPGKLARHAISFEGSHPLTLKYSSLKAGNVPVFDVHGELKEGRRS
jgi:hypothetical protein